MKKTMILPALFCCSVFFVCGDGPDSGVTEMDTSVIGFWEGMVEELEAIGFDGARIYTRITGPDSSFQLVSLALDTASSIQDTTLDMAGKWRMNAILDSILLLPDTCRIIDTTLNTLMPRQVRGSTIPLPMHISKNSVTGTIEWMVSFADLVPVAPLLGIDLTGVPISLLTGSKITLFKRSQ
ncbi:MAG: hypothetical protein JW768_03985 [Chitinispirillaceae bacterium]|nr:hypothetical protein [Chitinispirillaceae bacterium]